MLFSLLHQEARGFSCANRLDPLACKKAFHIFLRIKRLQIVNGFSHANQFYGQLQFPGDCDYYASLGRTVQFGKHNTGQFAASLKTLLEPGHSVPFGIKHEQHLVARAKLALPGDFSILPLNCFAATAITQHQIACALRSNTVKNNVPVCCWCLIRSFLSAPNLNCSIAAAGKCLPSVFPFLTVACSQFAYMVVLPRR